MNTSRPKKSTKFLVTGGHLTPAMAVLDDLKASGYSWFFWVGRIRTMKGDKNPSAEYNVITKKYKIPFSDFKAAKIIRFNSIKTFIEFLIELIKVPISLINSIQIIRKFKPDVIVSFGGYLAIPIVIIGKIFGIPIVTHEQTVVLGSANKFISRFADKICYSWKSTYEENKSSKAVLTGNPLRKEVFNVSTTKFDVNPTLKTIYITGGNQGAHVINENVFQIMNKLLKKYNVIHQTGSTTITNDYMKGKELQKKLKKRGKYIVKENIYGTEIGEVFSKADMVISRSGANTLTELLALGKLSILIPIPWSLGNEQYLNAKVLEDLGLGKIIEEKNLSPEVLFEIINLCDKNLEKNTGFNEEPLKKIQIDAKSKVKLNASELIVKEILNLI